MRKEIVIPLILVACLCLSSSGATRIQLGDASATASTSYASRDPKYAVNGAGLNASGEHGVTANATMWMSSTFDNEALISQQWFRVDLGDVLPLSHFKLWNFNFNNGTSYSHRGIKDCEVYLSTSATTPPADWNDSTAWTRVYANLSFAQASAVATYTGEPVVSLAGHQARWLLIRALSTFKNAEKCVGLSELQVFAEEGPFLDANPALNVETNLATISATLSFLGTSTTTNAEVFVFWGDESGGAVSSAWDHVQSLGSVTGNVNVVAHLPVEPNREYAYRFFATNILDARWSAVQSLMTAPIAVELPAQVSEGAGSVSATFRRPGTLTALDLPVTFSFKGDAIPGEDYFPPPTTVTLPSGSDSIQLQIPLWNDISPEPDKTLTIKLDPGACLVTSAGTNTVTLVDDDETLQGSRWRYSMLFTLVGYSGDSTLKRFTAPLRLNESIPGFRYADFGSPVTGADLRISDPATGEVVAFEIEHWNTNGTSIVWVQVPALASSETQLRLHWGSATATLPTYAQNGYVWQGFGGVWHLQRPNATDSTVNGLDGTANGNIDGEGLLGIGQYFNNASYIQVPDHPAIGSIARTNLTVSLWLKSVVDLKSGVEGHRFLEKGDNYFLVQSYSSFGGSLGFLTKNDAAINYVSNGGGTIPSNTWTHVCGTFDGATMRFFVNGSPAGSKPLTVPINDSRLPLRIGADDSGNAGTRTHGWLDEVRVEPVVRDAAWIKACYDSQKPGSTFVTFGPVEETPRGTFLQIL